tara:strand:- start:226 stop:696 length:471 start_codon:yes stop_codon:yes gene_type:complete
MSTMFKIEKNILMPTRTQDAEKYPFNQMEVGDSFIASTEIKSFSGIADDVKKRNEAGDGRLFHCISRNDGISHIMRVWRISPRDYLDMNPCENKNLLFIQRLIYELGPQTHTKITHLKLGEYGSGSKADRKRILKKYAYLFKKTTGNKGGVIYENI